MINFKLIITVYAVIGILIILDDVMSRKKNVGIGFDIKSLKDLNQAVSNCGQWKYVLRPAERSVAIINNGNDSVLEVLSIPFIPGAIRITPDGNQLNIISVDGVTAGELKLQISTISNEISSTKNIHIARN
jgi:hypothetical protein